MNHKWFSNQADESKAIEFINSKGLDIKKIEDFHKTWVLKSSLSVQIASEHNRRHYLTFSYLKLGIGVIITILGPHRQLFSSFEKAIYSSSYGDEQIAISIEGVELEKGDNNCTIIFTSVSKLVTALSS